MRIEIHAMPIEPSFKFNELYAPVFFTKKRIIDIWGGRGRGGSYFATDYALFLITRPEYCRVYFVRQVFGDIRESLFRELKDRITDNPSLNIKDFAINDNEMKIMYRPTGNMIISKGVKAEGSRTAKMKSLAGGTHIIIEEADEIGEDDFMQMNLSLRTIKGKIQIIRIFNPPGKFHFFWNDYMLMPCVEEPGYFTATAKKSSDVLSIFSTFRENITHINESSLTDIERLRVKKPEYYKTVILGLISEGQKGRIFSGWESITNQEFNDIDAKSLWGLDFGISSPAGLVEMKFVKNNIYAREHNYRPLTVKEIAVKMCLLKVGTDTIIGDSAEPHSISRLRRGWDRSELTDSEIELYPQLLGGFNIYPAAKGPGSIMDGINTLKDANIFITEDSSNIWLEYREYKWTLDKNKNPTDEPLDDFNHLIDPMRYGRKAKDKYY